MSANGSEAPVVGNIHRSEQSQVDISPSPAKLSEQHVGYGVKLTITPCTLCAWLVIEALGTMQIQVPGILNLPE